jgi:Fe-Mn family superoxide dismutase
MNEKKGKFYLPELPYAANALEPHINEETIQVHHFMLHKKYVDQLNDILDKFPELRTGLEWLITEVDKFPEEVRTGVLRNAGGVLNHDYYFDMMRPAPNDNPAGKLGAEIDKQFGSFDEFKKAFTASAMSVFGSGWTWLATDEAGKLHIINTEYQVTPYSFGKIPIIPLDIWEHSFFQQYPGKRAAYIEAWFNVADWEKADAIYDSVV